MKMGWLEKIFLLSAGHSERAVERAERFLKHLPVEEPRIMQ